MALCLETASLQRWKCETLIDHFNWKPFVLRATERERERGLRANVRGTKKNPVSTLRTATCGLTLNKTKKKEKTHTTQTLAACIFHAGGDCALCPVPTSGSK